MDNYSLVILYMSKAGGYYLAHPEFISSMRFPKNFRMTNATDNSKYDVGGGE